jgi:hypothetical protein
MIHRTPNPVTVPAAPNSNEGARRPTVVDRRPRFLRWLLPTACATAAPLDGQQQAELKLIAYH